MHDDRGSLRDRFLSLAIYLLREQKMFGRGRTIFWIAGALIGSIATAGIFSTLVQNKPWGVPDVLREDYDAKMERLTIARAVSSGSALIDVPSIETSRTKAKLNDVLSGQRIEHAFDIKNIGRDVLKLHLDFDNSHPEDDVDFDWQLESYRMAPNEATKLIIAWEADPFHANQERHLRIETNDPLRPWVRFSVFASVTRPLIIPASIDAGKSNRAEVFTASFYVASETSEDLGILGVSADLDQFSWEVKPVDPRDLPADFDRAKSVSQISIQGSRDKYGAFREDLSVDLVVDGEPVQRTIAVSGIVKAPITFLHPDMHRTDGLSIGTVSSDEDFVTSVAIRHRGEPNRTLAILDYEPKFLEPTLEPGSNGFSASRLTIKIPKGTPTHSFDRADHHGYIEVGDPNDKGFSGWFTIYGGVFNQF
jgi:hypothetical protein